MRDQAVVLHAEHDIAACLGGLDLGDDPLLEIGTDGAARLMLVFAVGGIVRAVAAGVDDDEGVAVCRTGNVGQAARFLTGRRSVGRDDGRVRVNEVVDALEVLRLRARGGHGLAVGGVEVQRVRVTDVMVAVDDIDLQAGNVPLQLLQRLCQRLMALLLAVFGQVAGDQKYVRLVLTHGVEHRAQDGVALGEHLAVAVERGRIICGIADHGRRQIVVVGHDGDLQHAGIRTAARILRGESRHTQGQHQRHCQQQRQQAGPDAFGMVHLFLL